MVDLHFITSDNATQKGIIFLMIPAQKAVTDVQMVASVPFSEFWNSSYTNPMEVQSVADDFIGRTTNLQVVCNFTDSHPFVSKISAQICSMFPLVIDVDERFDHSSATLVWLLHF
jgi:hypothetical protein